MDSSWQAPSLMNLRKMQKGSKFGEKKSLGTWPSRAEVGSSSYSCAAATFPSCGDSGLQRWGGWGWLEKISELICTIFNFCRVKAPKFFACFKCSFNLHVIILPHHFFCLATAPCLLDLTRRVMQRNLPLATLGNMFSAINIRTITQALDN